MNQVFIVGRIVSDPQKIQTESERTITKMCLAVNRTYKNTEGVYETDFIDITLWDGIAENVINYCHKGDIVGVKGRLETHTYMENDVNKKALNVIAEKVTFLSSHQSSD